MIYRMLEVEARQQLISTDEYHVIIQKYDILHKHTHENNIMVATKLMDDIQNLKQSLENYLSECITDIISHKKLEQAIELQNNLLKYGFADKCKRMEQFIEANKIKEFKYKNFCGK
jgi:hypothetical protein